MTEQNSVRDLPLCVVTTSIAADLVRHIVGNKLRVVSLMGPGTDPHLYKPALQDVKQLAVADVIVVSGLHLEGKMASVLERLAGRKKIVVLSNALTDADIRRAMGPGTAPDPHFWFSVRLWDKALWGGQKALGRYYPADSAVFRKRALAYNDSLQALRQWVGVKMMSVSKAKRVLITSHDAFGYLGRDTDTEVRPLQGISTAAEFGLRDVSDLVSFISARRIKTIYPEASIPLQALRSVQEGCEARGANVRLGPLLLSDALGPAGSPGDTYIGMIRYNVTAIADGLR